VARALIVLLCLAGCTERALGPAGASIPPGPYAPFPAPKQVAVSGQVIDVVRAALADARATIADPQAILAAAVVPDVPVYAAYSSLQGTPVVDADDAGDFTIEVDPNKTVHFVAGPAAAPSIDNTSVSVQEGRTGQLLHYADGGPSSAVTSLADALQRSAALLIGDGLCVVVTHTLYANEPPMANYLEADSGDVWAVTDPTPVPPTVAKQGASPVGIFVVIGDGTEKEVTLFPGSTDGSTYGSDTCGLRPGFQTVAYAPL
jgi:hypothetical protein